jgi:hypothetical protein
MPSAARVLTRRVAPAASAAAILFATLPPATAAPQIIGAGSQPITRSDTTRLVICGVSVNDRAERDFQYTVRSTMITYAGIRGAADHAPRCTQEGMGFDPAGAQPSRPGEYTITWARMKDDKGRYASRVTKSVRQGPKGKAVTVKYGKKQAASVTVKATVVAGKTTTVTFYNVFNKPVTP